MNNVIRDRFNLVPSQVENHALFQPKANCRKLRDPVVFDAQGTETLQFVEVRWQAGQLVRCQIELEQVGIVLIYNRNKVVW